MGMRPRMHLIFGIDDFDGELDSEELEQESLFLPDDKIKNGPFEMNFLKDAFYDWQGKKWEYVTDSLFWGGWGMGHMPEVIGMSINQTRYNSDLVRALSLFHEEYKSYGKKDIPVWDKEKHKLYARRLCEVRYGEDKRHLPTCGDIEFQWSWFYPSTVEQHNMWPAHAYCTRWLLRQTGIEIDYRRYKAMLVWEWS